MLVLYRIQVVIWFSCAVLLRQIHGFTLMPIPAIRKSPLLLTRQQRWTSREDSSMSRGTTTSRVFADIPSLHETQGARPHQRFPLLLGGVVAGLSTYLRKMRDPRYAISNTMTSISQAVSISSVPMLILASAVVLSQTLGLQATQAFAAIASQGGTWYMAQLNAYPLITKSVTSGVIGVMGDFLAQCLERRMQRKRTHHSNETTQSLHGSYDMRRGLAILIDGIFVSGPIMHWGYNWFERIVPISQGRSLAAMIHVVADFLILDSIFVGTAIMGTGLIEGYRFRKDIVPQLKRDYAATLKAGWATNATLMPLGFVCFRFLPVTLRTVAMNLMDVIWNGIISFMAHRSRQKENPASLLAEGEC